jgi:hypothetical protein
MSQKKSKTGTPSETSCPKCGHEAGSAAFCPDCGAKVRGASTDEKRARLEGTGSGRKGMGPIIAIVAAVVIGGGGYFALKGGSVQRAESIAATPGTATAGGSGITIPVGTFDDGKAHYYQWDSPSGRKLKFFVLKSSDGVIRAAFDACDVCFASKKGYRQEGDFMVCNNCGQRFESVRVNEVKGGCNPSPLERTIEGGNVVITAAALQTGEKYF